MNASGRLQRACGLSAIAREVRSSPTSGSTTSGSFATTCNLAGGQLVTTGRQVPSCMFTDPELARIGLNEREAKARGIGYRLAKVPMTAVLRTRTLSEE